MTFVSEKAERLWQKAVPREGKLASKHYKESATAVGRYGSSGKKLVKRLQELIDNVDAHFPDAPSGERKKIKRKLQALQEECSQVVEESKSLKSYYKMCADEMLKITEWVESVAK